MCGLVGMVGDITIPYKDMFADLLVVDTIRGPHSTGILSVNGAGDVQTLKRACLPQDLFAHRDYDRVVGLNLRVLIGHNRWATKGAVNSMNAHPFSYGTIHGAHNGTLHRQDLLPDYKHFEVDSENLIYAIDKIGLDEALKLTDGAFALTLWDEKAKQVQLVRNDERPLWCCFSKNRQVMVWASEPWMIMGCGTRTKGVELEDHIFPLDPLLLHTIKPSERINTPLPEIETRKVEEAYSYNYGNGAGWSRWWDDGGNASSGERRDTHYHDSRTHAGFSIGDTVRFYAITKTLQGGGKYLVEGLEADMCQKEVWVFVDEGLAHDLIAHDGAIEGTVCAFARGNWDQGKQEYVGDHITMRDNSLKFLEPYEPPEEEEDEEEEPPRVFLDEHGNSITGEEFHRITPFGCSFCSVELGGEYGGVFDNLNNAWCDDCWADLQIAASRS